MNLLLLVGIGLLLLVAGTLLGRFYIPDRRPLKRAAEEGRSYVRGLVGVLEGDNDLAIKELALALKSSGGAVEAYFALGALFRQRKEYERAVRVHQAILMRRRQPRAVQHKAHFQLALDFRAAGFNRRAIKALEWLVAKDKKHLKAWRQLVDLYQEMGQWERAALGQRRVGKLAGEDTGPVEAHIWAQLANEELTRGEANDARRNLKRALSAHRTSAHALHVLACYQEDRGKLDAAARAWSRALRGNPDLVGFLLPRLETVLAQRNKLERADKLLDELLEQEPGNGQLRLARARMERRHGPERALRSLEALVAEQPRLLPARRDAARLILREGDPARMKEALGELVELLDTADRGYRCGACGHADEALFWRCPRCLAWDTVGSAWGRRKGEQGTRN